MARHSLGDTRRGVGMLNLSGDERIKPDDFRAVEGNVSLRGIGLLRLQRMANEKAIKLRLTAGERLHGMLALELLGAETRLHGSALSNTDGSRKSRSSRAWRRGGASSALMKASHLASSSVK